MGRPWTLINDPISVLNTKRAVFGIGKAQMAIEPATQSGPFDTWRSVFEHCGEGLNEAVAENAWCQQHDVRGGSDYLMLWAALLFKSRSSDFLTYSSIPKTWNSVQSYRTPASQVSMKGWRGY